MGVDAVGIDSVCARTIRPAMKLHKQNPSPIIWMNVTTSANWTRPPVGIVRVEQALCRELAKLYSKEEFKQCVWMDGEFVEHIAAQAEGSCEADAAAQLVFPKSASFDVPRRMLSRAIAAYQLEKNAEPSGEVAAAVDVRFPLSGNNLGRPGPGDILVSVGLDWDYPYSAEFYKIAATKDIKLITCCYDLIPVLYPQYCVGDVASRFKEYFNMLAWGSAAVLCISEQTKRDYDALCVQIGAPLRPSIVFPLGDNVPASVGEMSAEIVALTQMPYILFVSTIERRKNHEVLYRAYHLLAQAGYRAILPKLVFVGMPGWGVNDLLKDIELDPLTSGLIVQLNHVTDNELCALYEHALFCVFPSLYEGWGLPVGEALALGKAVLASGQGSLPEVGGELVRYLPPWNPQVWANAILEMISSPTRIADMEKNVRKSYSPREWSAAGLKVKQVIDQVFQATEVGKERVLYPGYDFSTNVGVHVGATLQSTGDSGFLMFGPHRSLQAGHYMIQVFDAPMKREAGKFAFDCVGAGGDLLYWQNTILVDDAMPSTTSGQGDLFPLLHFNVSIAEDTDNYEIRCVRESGHIVLTKVVITRLSHA